MLRIRLYAIICTVFLLGACGNTEHEGDNPGNNSVEGVWTSYFEDTDSIVLIRVFTPDYYSFFSYAEGKKQNELNKSRYRIDYEHIYLSSYTQTYKLINDSLWITNSQKDQTTKYIRTGFID